jgi:hypothetical protein
VHRGNSRTPTSMIDAIDTSISRVKKKNTTKAGGLIHPVT